MHSLQRFDYQGQRVKKQVKMFYYCNEFYLCHQLCGLGLDNQRLIELNSLFLRKLNLQSMQEYTLQIAQITVEAPNFSLQLSHYNFFSPRIFWMLKLAFETMLYLGLSWRINFVSYMLMQFKIHPRNLDPRAILLTSYIFANLSQQSIYYFECKIQKKVFLESFPQALSTMACKHKVKNSKKYRYMACITVIHNLKHIFIYAFQNFVNYKLFPCTAMIVDMSA